LAPRLRFELSTDWLTRRAYSRLDLARGEKAQREMGCPAHIAAPALVTLSARNHGETRAWGDGTPRQFRKPMRCKGGGAGTDAGLAIMVAVRLFWTSGLQRGGSGATDEVDWNSWLGRSSITVGQARRLPAENGQVDQQFRALVPKKAMVELTKLADDAGDDGKIVFAADRRLMRSWRESSRAGIQKCEHRLSSSSPKSALLGRRVST
jgi:hypothetical protein